MTDAIQETIRLTPELLPFKTKGVLLAVSSYEALERNRYRIAPVNQRIEGILDGGHNTLAIGMYILSKALEANERRIVKLSATPLRNRPHMVFCSQGTS